MTLRQKTLLIISLTLLSLLMALYVSLSTIWLNGFAKIESQLIHSNVERVTDALANDLIELNSTARDWAGWDDTYIFVKDGNQNYIQTNLGDSAIANLRLNVMLFINKAGRIIYGKGLDLQQKVAVPVPDSLRQYLATNPRLLQHQVADSSYTGMVMLPEGPLLVASQPVVNSDRTSSIAGTLILGHFLNADQVKRFSQLTHLAIAVYPFQDARLPSDFQAVKRQLKNQTSNSQTKSQSLTLVRTLSNNRIAGYTLLKDIEGQPGLLLRVDIPRDIYQQGQQGLRYLVGAILAGSLVFGIVTLLLLEKSVLSPLARFVTTVRQIRASSNLSGRLLIRSRDELSRLGIAINQLLATLQQSQLQLSESEDRYRSVVNNVKEVIFQTDTSGIWIFLNPAWTDITGFSIEQSLGRPCRKFIHPEDQLYHSKQFQQLMEGKTQDTRYEIRYQTHNGEYRWFEVHSRITFEECSAKAGTAGTLNDITARKLAEIAEHKKTQQLEQTLQELRQTQAQLIQSEKMSSLGQLVAGIAHEINNPISFVYGNIEYANKYIHDLLHLMHSYQENYPNPPPILQAEIAEVDLEFLMDDLPDLLKSMKVGAERIREIVLSLRNFSRLDESEIKAVDLHEGIDSTLLILKHRLKPNERQPEIQIIKDYGNLPLVECYPGQLNQVFMNLLANAIDALEEVTSKRQEVKEKLTTSERREQNEESSFSPTIWIRTEVVEKEARVTLDSNLSVANDDLRLKSDRNAVSNKHNPATPNSLDASASDLAKTDGVKERSLTHVVIRIADNGSGMTEAVRTHLFDPFFTTKPIGKGT
ncbi:MAG TPA: hypothetical protein DCP31_04010, partial [Cyanobacteria bacterium UBA8543]|nr:hypothetical protein [Cyanobacteria bacterium UBA8543]